MGGTTLGNSSIHDNGAGKVGVGGVSDGVNALHVYGNIEATTVSASLFGTATSASFATSASYAPSTPSSVQTLTTIATSSNYGITCSFADIKEYLSMGTGGVIYSFTCSNTPSAGQYSAVSLFIENTSTPTSSLSFPVSWTFIGTVPSALTASKNAYLNLEAFGSSIVAAWGDQY